MIDIGFGVVNHVQNGPATTLLKAVKIHVGNKAIEVPGAIYKAISADATYTTRQMITAVLDRFEVRTNSTRGCWPSHRFSLSFLFCLVCCGLFFFTHTHAQKK